MIRSIEAFLRGTIGITIGLIPAKYFFDSIPLIIIIAGIGGVIGEIIIPKLIAKINIEHGVDSKPTTIIFKLIFGLIVSIAFTLACFQIYMTYDKYEYGQKLRVVSFANIRMNEKPFFKGNTNKLIKVLQAGEVVTYIAKQPRRLARRTNMKYYLDFWREVKTKDGKHGWVYGAYLQDI